MVVVLAILYDHRYIDALEDGCGPFIRNANSTYKMWDKFVYPPNQAAVQVVDDKLTLKQYYVEYMYWLDKACQVTLLPPYLRDILLRKYFDDKKVNEDVKMEEVEDDNDSDSDEDSASVESSNVDQRMFSVIRRYSRDMVSSCKYIVDIVEKFHMSKKRIHSWDEI